MRAAARAVVALAGAALLPGACASADDPAVLAAARADLDALAARSAPDGDPSTVDVLVAPDEEYLRRLGPEAVPFLELAVAALDRGLGPEVGLRFRVGGAALFEGAPEADDLPRILAEARLGIDRGRCDLVAAFTGRRCGPRSGAAEPRLRLLLAADAGDPVRSLLHEAARLFGALDYDRGHPGWDEPGLMSRDPGAPRNLVLDPVNLARVRARRGTLPPAEPDALAAALRARVAALGEPLGRDLREALLAAGSRTQHAAGAAAAERLLAERPAEAAGLWAHAECLRLLGRPAEARERFARALEALRAAPARDAVDRLVVLETARLAVDGIDRLDGLDAPLERELVALSAAFPGDAEILDLRASFRARARDREAAAPLYREAAAAAPGDPGPWRRLADLARADGDPAPWLAAWEGALAADPLDPVLRIRWIEEGLEVYPDLIRSDAHRRAVDAALEGAEGAYPRWVRPAELRRELKARSR